MMPVPSEILAEETIYSPEQLALIDSHRVPSHVAIIMDGNRRWARERGLPPAMGHWEGAEVLTDVVKAASELGIKTVTVYAFSTENWGRSDSEIEGLMNIFELYLMRKRELMVKDGIRLNAIGDLSRMPENVRAEFVKSKQATECCEKINLVLALNYGSRDEIRRMVVKILKEYEEKKIDSSSITEEKIAQYLDTVQWGDPDLLIRTSGEQRLSNFLLWQSCYAELYMTDVLWPDFSPKQLLEAVFAFQSRQRRRGG